MTSKMMLVTIVCCAIIMFTLRYIPFALFTNKEVPSWLRRLGTVLPSAIMATLVIYCLRTTSVNDISTLLPTVAGVFSTVIIHIIKKNTILSVFTGTAAYMILLYLI